MYIHVYTKECTYHVHTMYIRVYTFAEMYIHVGTCLCFSNIVDTMSVSCCTIAWYVHGTYMVQTCLYTFMPGGQDSRWCAPHSPPPLGRCYPAACPPRARPQWDLPSRVVAPVLALAGLPKRCAPHSPPPGPLVGPGAAQPPAPRGLGLCELRSAGRPQKSE